MGGIPTSNVNCPVLASGYVPPYAGGNGGLATESAVGLLSAAGFANGAVQIYLDPAYGPLARADIILELTPDNQGNVDGTSFFEPEITNYVSAQPANFTVKMVNTKTAAIVDNSGCGFWFKVSKLIKKV